MGPLRVLLVVLLLGPPVVFGAPAPSSAVTEAGWRDYLQTGTGAEPAVRFPHEHCFRRAAASTGLPVTLLLAVARGESDFDPRARSDANAHGLMQIQWPGTARHLGIHRLSSLYDPCTNVDAGSRYLRELLERYRGDLHRALAAYNYGPTRIDASGPRLPDGAAWYSAYILRHLRYVMGPSKPDTGERRDYAEERQLEIIFFKRPLRARGYIEHFQKKAPDLRLSWLRAPLGRFRVVMLYSSEDELRRGCRMLRGAGVEPRSRRCPGQAASNGPSLVPSRSNA